MSFLLSILSDLNDGYLFIQQKYCNEEATLADTASYIYLFYAVLALTV